MSNEALVIVSCPDKIAESIAQALVSEQLAACVSIVPNATSIYHWQGKIEKAKESLLMIKTNKSRWIKLTERIKELHSYEVPEIILVPIEAGHAPYLKWLNQAVGIEVVGAE